MRILEYPKVQQINPHEWKLLDHLTYSVHNDPNDLIEVPEGFITDFASVPRIFWNIIPPFGEYSSAAVIHDFLYNRHGDVPEGKHRSRKDCDLIFLEAMEVMSVPWWKRQVMYRAVRTFGWWPWDYRAKKIAVV